MPLSVGPAEAAAALAAEYAGLRVDDDGDDDDDDSGGGVERAGSRGGGSETGGDLEAYLRDMLGGSSDEESEGEGEEGRRARRLISPRFSPSADDADDEVDAEAVAAAEDTSLDADADADATFATPTKGGDEWETVDVSSAEKKAD